MVLLIIRPQKFEWRSRSKTRCPPSCRARGSPCSPASPHAPWQAQGRDHRDEMERRDGQVLRDRF